MQQIKYASTAWNDIKNSPGWKKKVALLALLQIIPIFGQIVLFGYLFGWARDIAWGVHSPMPARIFGNEDGKLFSRGFFIFVILFVFSLVPTFISSIGAGLAGGGIGYSLSVNDYTPGFLAGTFASLFGLISFALSFAILIAFNIAAMRTAIYDRISAGFQLKKLWAMFRYDSNGALRIFGMQILVGLIGGLVIGFVAAILFGISGLTFIPGFMALEGMSNPGFGDVMGAFGPGLGLMTLLALVIGFFAAMFGVVVYAMVARASGYWTQQFQVAQWRGQDDPMPFEAAAAAAAAQQAQYAAQVEYAQAQAQYAQAQGAQINYADAQAQQQYAAAQQQVAQAQQVQQTPVAQTPAEPAAPAEPVVPVEPAAPVTPAEPVVPTEPAAPAEPAEPAAPETPAAPADSANDTGTPQS